MIMDEYPSDSDYRIFVEEKFGRNKTQKFLKQRKNFIVHAHTKSDVANVTRRILFGLEDAEHLKEGLLSQNQPEKSTALTFKSDATDEELSADLSRAQASETVFNENKSLRVSDTSQSEEGLEVELEYIHRRESQRALMDSNDKTTTITIEDTGEENVRKVSQDYRTYDEFNAVKDFFEGWNNRRVSDGQEPVERGDIILRRLRLEDRVEFFNDILSANPANWRFEDAVKMGIRQGEQTPEMFEDAEDEEDIQEELDENLRGITGAVLSGEGLRTNGFVQKCVDNGYFFESGRLLFVNTDIAEQVEISIEFKQKPKETFDISIENEYETTEDEREETSFDPEYRKEVRDTFRDLVVRLYGEYVDMPNLIDEKYGPQELTDLKGIGESTAENLQNDGFDSIEGVLDADRDELLEIDGIGETTVDNILGD